ncbi:hypothetical protein T459_27505 [Capsicum annuum]|uniref:Uncharacterized protein n=1 Tax=Capsicum annuum TaxID=4072 RepID=A0A2G2YE54_CAPAN|nr:hypothetical protein T459_27505 [Capsicum annuum]
MKPSRDNPFKDILDSKNYENEEVQLMPPETARTIIEIKLSLSFLEGINDDMEFYTKLVHEESVIILPGKTSSFFIWLLKKESVPTLELYNVKVTISKDDTVILDGASQKKSIEERCEQIKSAIELSTSNYDKEKLQERLAKISGGVAEMHV